MKYPLVYVALMTFQVPAAPCGGAKVGQWMNSDKTRGGWVASTAKVAASVFVGPEVQICEQATVSGKTRVFGRAKVFGKAVVKDSIVCQTSQINFTVLNSDYYCQTDDPEPEHPGEAGEKTLLGIDSDHDGVRDDLEVWINDSFPNTPKKNRKATRVEFKKYSTFANETIRFSGNKSEVENREHWKDASMDCLWALEGFEEINNKRKLHTALLTNTKDRWNAYWGAQKHLAGWGGEVGDDKENPCQFSKP